MHRNRTNARSPRWGLQWRQPFLGAQGLWLLILQSRRHVSAVLLEVSLIVLARALSQRRAGRQGALVSSSLSLGWSSQNSRGVACSQADYAFSFLDISKGVADEKDERVLFEEVLERAHLRGDR
jgi:hypothetical protein